MSAEFQIRVTGVLIENGEILLVKQRLSEKRGWSLPGGRLEQGESLASGLCREMQEETGLLVRPVKLLYLCDSARSGFRLVHISFLLERIGGALTLPTNEFDQNPISDVRFVPLARLEEYGFSSRFRQLAQEGFPGCGSYMGDKANIGLDI